MAIDFGKPLSDEQRGIVSEAIGKAIVLCEYIINDEIEDLGIKLADLPATRWRKTESRTKGVQNDFKKIKEALGKLDKDSFGVKVGSPGKYAEVYPDIPFKITLFTAFWNMKDAGTDSKAGTLIHEVSHWVIVRGTDDHGYGEDSEDLSFTLSRNNADTWEAIAESYDLPYQPENMDI